jgi:hypothetical protein
MKRGREAFLSAGWTAEGVVGRQPASKPSRTSAAIFKIDLTAILLFPYPLASGLAPEHGG